jgi:protein-S-isoprenylcysteine O-methyltransferase Ste14
MLRTIAAILSGPLFFAVVLFIPAGTVNYWQAWVFIALFTVMSAVPLLYWAVRKPEVLERRMRSGPSAETRAVQKVATTGIVVTTIAVSVISALDHRLGWSQVPTAVVVLGDVLFAVAFGAATVVIAQNEYAAATITVESQQPVISTGLYGVVRHPMYTFALLIILGMPLALDSYWGLVAAIPAPAMFVVRILDEEKALRADLAGYLDYTEKVRYRLAPGIW